MGITTTNELPITPEPSDKMRFLLSLGLLFVAAASVAPLGFQQKIAPYKTPHQVGFPEPKTVYRTKYKTEVQTVPHCAFPTVHKKEFVTKTEIKKQYVTKTVVTKEYITKYITKTVRTPVYKTKVLEKHVKNQKPTYGEKW